MTYIHSLQKILLVTTLLGVCSARAASPAASLDQIAEKASANEYRKLLNTSLKMEDCWFERVTPFFPDAWPLAVNGKLVSYSYLHQTGGITDGERLKGPWCKITINPLDPAATLRIVRLKYANVNTDVQGVHPSSASELRIHKTQGSVYQILTSMFKGEKATKADLSAVKQFYRSWRSNNGVIAKNISTEQKSFFNWLDSKE